MLSSAVYFNVITRLEFMKEFYLLITREENDNMCSFYESRNYEQVISKEYVSSNFIHWSKYEEKFKDFDWATNSFDYQYAESLSYSYSKVSAFYESLYSAEDYYKVKQCLVNWEATGSWDYTFYNYYNYVKKCNSFFENSYFENRYDDYISKFKIYSEGFARKEFDYVIQRNVFCRENLRGSFYF
jgi:hypothetical protein